MENLRDGLQGPGPREGSIPPFPLPWCWHDSAGPGVESRPCFGGTALDEAGSAPLSELLGQIDLKAHVLDLIGLGFEFVQVLFFLEQDRVE